MLILLLGWLVGCGPGHLGGPWVEQAHVVSVWPLDERTRRRFHVDVNGTWAEGSPEEIARRHRRGERVVVSVQGLAAEAELLEERPLLREAVSNDLWGQASRVPWYDWLTEPVLTLSIAHPTFRAYLVERGRSAVDAKADGWFVDEIQTSALLVSREPYGAGFAPVEAAAFLEDRRYATYADYLLAEHQRAVPPDWGAREILLDPDPAGAAVRDAFFEEYKAFQEELAYRLMTEVIAEVRDHAADRGHDLAVGANLAGLGFYTDWSPLTAPIWSDSLDFVVFEHNPTSLSASNAPYYLLGRATVPGFVTAMPGLELAAELNERGDYATYLEVAYAEALAFEGSWGIGYWSEEMGWAPDALLPEELVPFTRFAQAHPELYEGRRAPHPVAVIYPNGAVLDDPAVHHDFYALCADLLARHVAFDVLYEGDARFRTVVPDTSGYAHVLRPGSEVPGDLPAMEAPDGILVALYERDGATSLHVVNRRYDEDTDRVEDVAPFTVAFEAPQCFDASWRARLLAPGRRPKGVEYTIEDGRIRLEVEELDVYAVVVLEP